MIKYCLLVLVELSCCCATSGAKELVGSYEQNMREKRAAATENYRDRNMSLSVANYVSCLQIMALESDLHVGKELSICVAEMNDASHKSRAFRVLLGWSRDDLLVALKVSKHSNADVFVVYGICLALEDRGPLVDLFRTLNGTGILEKVLYEQVSEELLEDGDFNTILLHPAAVADVYAMSEVIRRLKGTSLPMQETLLSAAVDAIKHNAVKRCLPYAVALAAKGKGESAKEFINALARLRLSAEEEKYIMHYIRRTGDGELASFASECFRES